MGRQPEQKELFSYQLDLDKRDRGRESTRCGRVAAAMDFSFVRAGVESTYGLNGNVSVDPVVVLKLMFLLFFDKCAQRAPTDGDFFCLSAWIVFGFWVTG